MYHVNQLTPNKKLLGVRTTLASEMCKTLFFPIHTQKEKIALWPHETRVGRQEFHSWIASLPLVSLLFIIIVIPTPFLNFYVFLVLLFCTIGSALKLVT